MTFTKCKFTGAARNEGRFGAIKSGDELLLSKTEYRAVSEDGDFEFMEEVQQELPTLASGKGLPPVEKSVGTKGEVKGAGRTASGPVAEAKELVVADVITEDDDEDEDTIGLEDATKAELLAEVDAINELRDEGEQIPRKGTKAELIQRITDALLD